MVRSEILVCESLSRSYPLLGVEDEHAFKKIDGYQHKLASALLPSFSMRPTRWVGVLELVLERLPLTLGERLDESQRLKTRQLAFKRSSERTYILASNSIDNVVWRGSKQLGDD